MKTIYAACLMRLGLSQPAAARLHGVRLDTVKSWSAGRNRPPDGVWDDLRGYEALIVDRSEACREAWEDAGQPVELDAGWDADDGPALMALADFVLSAPVIPKNECRRPRCKQPA